MSANSERSIHLAGFNLGKHRHVCAFFNNQEQEDKVLVPFLKEGIDQGEKVFFSIEPESRQHLMEKLRLAEVDITQALERGQLELKKWDEVYARDGHFAPDSTLAIIDDTRTQSRNQGFALTRFVGHMKWFSDYGIGIDKLLEYEIKLNSVLPRYPDPVICVYDLAKVSAGAVLDILRTHPVVLIGDLVAENPFFVPSDVLLRELNERNAAARRKSA